MSNLNSQSLFSDASLDIECPKCYHEFEVPFTKVGETITCPNCHIKINLEKDDGFDDSISDVDNALNDLIETFNNFGK